MRSTLLLTMLVGCERSTLVEDDPPPPPPPDLGEAESEGDGEGEVICREGLTACDGECVDLMTDDFHCGACGWACLQRFVYGHCDDGLCPPAPKCAPKVAGIDTCDDACAYNGQQCIEMSAPDVPGCGGGYLLHFDELTKTALEGCEGVGPHDFVEATCSTPIDWSVRGGYQENPAGAVRCCCTQESPT